jgi:hypothetical protein
MKLSKSALIQLIKEEADKLLKEAIMQGKRVNPGRRHVRIAEPGGGGGGIHRGEGSTPIVRGKGGEYIINPGGRGETVTIDDPSLVPSGDPGDFRTSSGKVRTTRGTDVVDPKLGRRATGTEVMTSPKGTRRGGGWPAKVQYRPGYLPALAQDPPIAGIPAKALPKKVPFGKTAGDWVTRRKLPRKWLIPLLFGPLGEKFAEYLRPGPETDQSLPPEFYPPQSFPESGDPDLQYSPEPIPREDFGFTPLPEEDEYIEGYEFPEQEIVGRRRRRPKKKVVPSKKDIEFMNLRGLPGLGASPLAEASRAEAYDENFREKAAMDDVLPPKREFPWLDYLWDVPGSDNTSGINIAGIPPAAALALMGPAGQAIDIGAMGLEGGEWLYNNYPQLTAANLIPPRAGAQSTPLERVGGIDPLAAEEESSELGDELYESLVNRIIKEELASMATELMQELEPEDKDYAYQISVKNNPKQQGHGPIPTGQQGKLVAEEQECDAGQCVIKLPTLSPAQEEEKAAYEKGINDELRKRGSKADMRGNPFPRESETTPARAPRRSLTTTKD